MTGYLAELAAVVQRLGVKRVLEWGTGQSTLELLRQGCEVVSIDHHLDWQEGWRIRANAGARLVCHCKDLQGPSGGQSDAGFAYSTLPLALGGRFDLFVIDGRRRMECAFVAWTLATDRARVLLHDWRRQRYQVVRALFDVEAEGNYLLLRRVVRS